MADMNVKFLQGTSTALNAMTSSTPGAFYLTTDENRLYYGVAANAKPVPLNEQVTVYEKWSELSKATDTRDNIIYYAADLNVLCIKDKVKGWTQINPDTDTDTSIQSVTVGAPVADAAGNYTYTLTVQEQNINSSATAKHEATFTITKDMIADLAVEVDVAVGSETVSNNSTTIRTSGVGADGATGVKISGSDNVKLSGAANNLKIEAVDTRYHVETGIEGEVVTVDLVNEETDKRDAFKVKAGAKLDVALADETITLNHETSGVTAGKYEASLNNDNINSQVLSVPGFTVDAYGHVTATEDKTLTVNTKSYTATAPTVGAQAGSIVVGLVDENDKTVTATSGQIFYNTITVDEQTKTVYNQQDLGTFYSAAAIDQKFKGLDAFTYKGTVGVGGVVATLPTVDVSIGDTYKASADGTYRINGQDVKLHAGDIIIANGTEGTNGYITGTISWDVIHSENNTDTTYVLTATGNEIILTDSNEASSKIAVEGDGVVQLTTSGNKVSAAHLTSGVNAGTYGGDGGNKDYNDSIAVPKITVDANGHVTAAETVNYKLPEEHEYNFDFDFDTEEIYIIEDETRKLGVKVTEDNWIDADLKSATNGAELAITHKNVSRSDSSSTAAQFDYNDQLTVVTGVTSDAKGHITGVVTETYTLPEKIEYELTGVTSDTAGGFKVTHELKDKNGVSAGKHEFSVTSSSLNISRSGDVVTADLVWGTF